MLAQSDKLISLFQKLNKVLLTVDPWQGEICVTNSLGKYLVMFNFLLESVVLRSQKTYKQMMGNE